VAVVADVEDRVALAGPDLELVVDLGDQRAHGVDHHPPAIPGRRDHLGGRAVGRQHQGRAGRHLVHVVDEDDAPGPELVDHVPVVDDLVVAVDGRLEDPHHPGQGLDGLLHPGTEPPRFGQQHSVHVHRPGYRRHRWWRPRSRAGPNGSRRGDRVAWGMSAPRVTTAPKVVAVTASSPADLSGLRTGDELLSLNGRSPRDVIEYSLLVDEPDLDLVVRRRGRTDPFTIQWPRSPGEPLGVEVSSAVFDRVRTCDNHCEFCFIHQLPKGMRRSLSLKDDDYRLSFLYGNFTTLTRFTEMDLERVLTERLSPLFVSIHATDPDIRAELLRNRRGATSLRWLGPSSTEASRCTDRWWCARARTTERCWRTPWPACSTATRTLATVACVPLGVSRFSEERAMRPHTRAEAGRGVRHRGPSGRRPSSPPSAGGWSSPPTSTT
jgi:hypothetical protein